MIDSRKKRNLQAVCRTNPIYVLLYWKENMMRLVLFSFCIELVFHIISAWSFLLKLHYVHPLCVATIDQEKSLCFCNFCKLIFDYSRNKNTIKLIVFAPFSFFPSCYHSEETYNIPSLRKKVLPKSFNWIAVFLKGRHLQSSLQLSCNSDRSVWEM